MVMSQDGVNKSRRTLLVGTTTALGAVGAGFVAVPFVKSWNPSERAKAAGAPAKVDVSKLESGAMIVVEWRGKPVYVTRRTEETLGLLESLNPKLKRSEEHTSELQSRPHLVCRLLLEKKKKISSIKTYKLIL